MKELKIFGVVASFTLLLYWGVEPYAHSILHPHVAPADYTFSDLDDVRAGKTGDITAGKSLIVDQFQCQSCHSLTVDGAKIGFAVNMGVTAPDLTSAGAIYDERFLAAFIADPAKAAKVQHKFIDGAMHPMTKLDLNYDGVFGDDDSQAVADIVAFLKSIAPAEMTNEEVYVDACGRCHDMKYSKNFASSDVSEYMGSTPPDLSMMIRSRGFDYLTVFVNDPQKNLHGTAMPRVGLNEKANTQVVTYMEEVGDSKKAEREGLAPYVLGFLAFMTVISFFWKKEVWAEVK